MLKIRARSSSYQARRFRPATAAKDFRPSTSSSSRARRRSAGLLFCAGCLATPAYAALMIHSSPRGLRGSGSSVRRPPRAAAIVEATTHFQDPERVAAASEGLGTAMVSLETRKLEEQQLLANRGW